MNERLMEAFETLYGCLETATYADLERIRERFSIIHASPKTSCNDAQNAWVILTAINHAQRAWGVNRQ